jgi:hypothetical protein
MPTEKFRARIFNQDVIPLAELPEGYTRPWRDTYAEAQLDGELMFALGAKAFSIEKVTVA